VSSSRFFQLLLLATAMGSTGCHWPSKPKPVVQPTSAPAPEVTWMTQPINSPPARPTPVKEGPIPLVYLLESPAMIRVADSTENQDLLRMPVSQRTIIAVTAGGVTIGGATMKLGPLPTDHRYTIYLENTESNYIRTGAERPGKLNKPAPTTAESP
jgi:hypothetical protein